MENRRNDLRAVITLPFSFRVLASAEVQPRMLAVRMEAQPALGDLLGGSRLTGDEDDEDGPGAPHPADPRLLERLDRLEGRLDRIVTLLETLAARRHGPTGETAVQTLPPPRPTELELSAGGLGFVWDSPVPSGRSLEILLHLPGEGGRQVSAVLDLLRSTVVTTEDGVTRWRLAGHYSALRDSDRSAIVRLLFDHQRITARSMRSGRQS